MKVAFVCFDYFPFGGMQKDMLAIARACQARGAEVRIFVKRWEGERPADLPVEVVPTRGLTNGGRNRDFIQRLPGLLGHWGADVTVGFQRMPGLDFYYAADSCFAAKALGQRGRLYRSTRRARDMLASERAVFGADASTRLLMISEPEIEVYRQWYQTPAERFTLLPPGISRDRIAPADAEVQRAAFRAEFSVADDEKLLLLVGSGFRTKGLDRAIGALAGLPASVRLFVVGQDDARPFQRLAGRLGVEQRVRFFGGRKDVPRFLLGADLLVHPAYRENTGTVLLEAGVAGLPVVASAVCGYAHFIAEFGYGEVLAEPFQAAAFQQAISRVLAAPRQQWREAGARLAQADIYDMPARAAALIVPGA